MPTPQNRSTSKQLKKQGPPPVQKDTDKAKEIGIKELRETLYLYKILGCIWFEGDLPDDIVAPFSGTANPECDDPAKSPEEFSGLRKLSESELCYIAWQMKKPDWVMKYRSLRTVYTLLDGLLQIN